MIEGLPWGCDELAQFKRFLGDQVTAMEQGRGRIVSHGGVASEPNYKISPAKAKVHRRNIASWVPRERVLPDHRAEAVKIVYQGMIKAGVVPWSAYRRDREGFVG